MRMLHRHASLDFRVGGVDVGACGVGKWPGGVCEGGEEERVVEKGEMDTEG